MKKDTQKETYEKPRLRVIELAADEVLAVGCKAAGLNFAVGGIPSCGQAVGCSSLGT